MDIKRLFLNLFVGILVILGFPLIIVFSILYTLT